MGHMRSLKATAFLLLCAFLIQIFGSGRSVFSVAENDPARDLLTIEQSGGMAGMLAIACGSFVETLKDVYEAGSQPLVPLSDRSKDRQDNGRPAPSDRICAFAGPALGGSDLGRRVCVAGCDALRGQSPAVHDAGFALLVLFLTLMRARRVKPKTWSPARARGGLSDYIARLLEGTARLCLQTPTFSLSRGLSFEGKAAAISNLRFQSGSKDNCLLAGRGGLFMGDVLSGMTGDTIR